MMLKFDLQYFAEEISSAQFADMMENGVSNDEPTETEQTDNTATVEETGEVGTEEDTPSNSGENQHEVREVAEQDFKNAFNAKMAAERRRREEAERTQARVDEAYRKMFEGQVNPYTNMPINSEADYTAYMQRHQLEQQRAQLQEAGMSEADFDGMVNNDPRVQQAQQIIEENKRQQSIREMNEGLEAIRKLDPSVKTFQDLIDHESYAQMNELFKQGVKVADAFKLANFDRLMQGKQAAAKQQVLNETASKQHMIPTGQKGTGDEVIVPQETMDIYKALNPHMTEAQIKEHYKKSHKR